MLIASGCFVVGDTLVKVLGRELPVGEIIFVRGAFGSAVVLAMAARAGSLAHIKSAARPLLAWRSLSEAGSTCLFFLGLMQLSYADAAAIVQFAPLAVTAGAALFLAEPVGWRRWLAAVAGLIGVLLIVRPGTSAFSFAALLVVGCVVCLTARDLITRQIGVAIPALLVALASIAMVGLAGLAMMPFETWRTPTAGAWLLLVCATGSSVAGFYWMVVAMRSGEMAVVSPFRYAAMPFAVASSIMVFGDWPDAIALTGILIVMAAGLYTFHREQVRARERSVE